ncbi:glycosyltransferase family 87 protein [Cupriavidus pinatubonensis]|uniref:glycosyltransferase family 87 protein n=1 Tax=Cupriavidus pinatubonensis TaxID=248026 RepID=UPI00360D62F9
MPAAHKKNEQKSAAAATPAVQWLTPLCVRLYCGALFLIECYLFLYWFWAYHVARDPAVSILGWDFAVYWSASSLAMTHGAPAAYDWGLLKAAEASLLPAGSFGPFAYPPSFLLLIYPIAMLPVGMAFLTFLICGVVLYLAVTRWTSGPVRAWWLLPALGFPGLWVAMAAGQNSLFTLAVAGSTLMLLRRHPIAAGAGIALLCMKPQLGALFPLLLLCEKRWAAIASAAASSLLYITATWLAFGTETFMASARSITLFRHEFAENSIQVLSGAPTVFAVARTAGCSVQVSYLVHAIVAVAAVALCAWLWITRSRFGLSASAFIAASLLFQPYLLYYDLAWLALPISWLSVDFARRGYTTSDIALLIITWLAPLQSFLAVPYPAMGQWTPAVLLLMLAAIWHRHRLELSSRM